MGEGNSEIRKTIKALQEETVGLQEQLGLLVSQTSGLIADIQGSAKKGETDQMQAGSLTFIAPQIGLRQKQYQELSRRIQKVSEQMSALGEQDHTGSVAVTLGLLQQMETQVAMEEKQLQNLQEELGLWQQTSEADAVVEKVSLLERLKKGLEESKNG